MRDYRDPKESAKAVSAFAGRVMRRLAKTDVSTSREDVEQELWIAWCVACQNYDPASGVPFLAYLRNGMRLHVNRWVEKHFERRQQELFALSFDMKGEGSEDDTECGTLNDIIPSAAPAPDAAIEHRSAVSWAMSRLSPRAQMFVSILESQPVELLDEIHKIESRVEYARERGIPAYFSHRLTAAMVFDLMGADRVERVRINKELGQLAEKVEEFVING